ncbi:MAG: hypothetical protein NDI60_09725 [Elusimicrobiales bacterium]|nr:hypothetical protein [Elusimicrobiales bacterium]
MIKNLLNAVALCAALAAPALCAPSFELEAGLRLSSVSVQCVTQIPGGFRLYYSTPAHYAVFSASSTDGLVWTPEPGLRLSTQAAAYDASSITAMGVYYDAALAGGPWRAYYVGVSTDGHALLSARSADGLAWTRDASFSVRFSSGAARLRSPRAYPAGSGYVRLYYIRDEGGAENPAAYRVHGLTSVDNGDTFTGESLLLSATGAYSLDISTLTGGALRLYVTAPDLAASTVTRVLAADSATGTSFTSPPVLVFSTAAASNELSGMAVARSTETFRWRLYLTSRLDQAATTYVYSALTMDPVVTGFTPNLAYDDDPATDFTVTGEIFAPGLNTASLSGPAGSVTVQTVTRVSDAQLTVRALPAGAPLGTYNVSVSNPDGRTAALASVLTVDFRPGITVMTDNLFRPLKGGSARADMTVFRAGDMDVNIYTLNGAHVRRLYSGPVGAGTKTLFWDGRTDNGRLAASGLYLLRVTAPKMKDTRKIVLIK